MKLKSLPISIFLFSLLTFFIVFAFAEVVDDGSYDFTYGYDASTQTMTDNNGLRYKTTPEGWIKVIKDYTIQSYFGFGLEGTVDTGYQRYTVENFTWDWSHDMVGDEHIFTAYNNQPIFNWTIVYHFYPDHPMKITHILNNSWKDITDAKMWYINKISYGDYVEWNDNTYHWSADKKPKHWSGNLTDEMTKVKLLGRFVFNYTDIIHNGFTITDVYIGNASIVGHPEYDMMAIGFTKGTGNWNKGIMIEVDPTIEVIDSTGDVGKLGNLMIDSNEFNHITYLDNTNYKIVYCNDTTGSFTCENVSVTEPIKSWGVISLALDSNDIPHIAYDGTDNDCHYCNKTTGSWTCQQAVDNGFILDCPTPSIALDSNDNPSIATMYFSGGPTYGWAWANKTGPSTWSYESIVVDSTAGWQTTFELVIDNNDKPHILGWYLNPDPNEYWIYEKTTGSWNGHKLGDDDSGPEAYLYPSMEFNYIDNSMHVILPNISGDVTYCNSTNFTSYDCKYIASGFIVNKTSDSTTWLSLDISSNGILYFSGLNSNMTLLRYCNSTDKETSICEDIVSFTSNNSRNVYSFGDAIRIRKGGYGSTTSLDYPRFVAHDYTDTSIIYVDISPETYLIVTFNYSSVNFGSLSSNTSNNSAPNQTDGIYNVTVDTNNYYKVEALGTNFTDGGSNNFTISNLKMDLNSTAGNLAIGDAIILAETSQTINDNIPDSITANFHGFWLSIPEGQYATSYNSNITITYSQVT